MNEDGTWRQYQEDAASIFRRLGYETSIEAKVRGARAKHAVDVYVRGQIGGASFSWVIECKAWKSRVPKEKVLALCSVVQDVGADRGFLLSEVGFQSGAIEAATCTNIKLASIESITSDNLRKLQCLDSQHLCNRLSYIRGELTRRHKSRKDFSSSEWSDPLDEISYIELALEDGRLDRYPTVYTVSRHGDRDAASSWNELYSRCNALLDQVEATLRI